MNNKEKLQTYIDRDYITDDQYEAIVNMLDGTLFSSADMLKFCIGETNARKIDMSIPQSVFDDISKHFESKHMPNMAYSYIDNMFGTLVCIDHMFLRKIYDIFNP